MTGVVSVVIVTLILEFHSHPNIGVPQWNAIKDKKKKKEI